MTAPEQRRARRAWIAEHHPDRGGDPHAFVSGLEQFDPPRTDPAGTRLTVVRSRRPTRTLRRLARRITVARRRRTHHGSL